MTGVLVIGRNGQLGTELSLAAWPQGWDVEFSERSAIDLANPQACARSVSSSAADIVVLSAGYTAVEQAETDAARARAVNATSAGAIAKACAHTGKVLIAISTDYVFDGRKSAPYVETDAVNPLNVYGASKTEGELLIKAALRDHVILRTAWLFSPHSSNFLKTMLSSARQDEPLRVVSDQRGSPTAAKDLAAGIVRVCTHIAAGRGRFGTFHLVNAGNASWHQLAVAALDHQIASGRLPPRSVEAIASSSYRTRAKRPANSILSAQAFEDAYGMTMRPWTEALAKCLDDIADAARP